jgi:TolA-binding protein
MNKSIRSWTLAGGVAVLVVAACTAPTDQGGAAVASTQVALTAQPAPAANSGVRRQTAADARRLEIEQMRASLAKLSELEASVSEVSNTQDVVNQMRAQKQRIQARIRDVERNAQALQE